jgi:hypothetical protein
MNITRLDEVAQRDYRLILLRGSLESALAAEQMTAHALTEITHLDHRGSTRVSRLHQALQALDSARRMLEEVLVDEQQRG